MRKGPESLSTRKLIAFLEKTGRKNKARVWLEVARLLKKPRRKKRAVTLFRLNKATQEGDIVAVPTKIVCGGAVAHKITAGAFKASAGARKKLVESNCIVMTLRELVEKNPGGKRIKIIV